MWSGGGRRPRQEKIGTESQPDRIAGEGGGGRRRLGWKIDQIMKIIWKNDRSEIEDPETQKKDKIHQQEVE